MGGGTWGEERRIVGEKEDSGGYVRREALERMAGLRKDERVL